jgi:hypothetical protein
VVARAYSSTFMISDLEKLKDNISSATTVEDRNLHMCNFLNLCSNLLNKPRKVSAYETLFEIAYLLHDYPLEKSIWDWLKEVCHTTDLELREALTIVVFEPLPEPPTTPQDLSHLWSFGDDLKTSWVIENAYRHNPEQKVIDQKAYQVASRL